jgi:hypothetical protein
MKAVSLKFVVLVLSLLSVLNASAGFLRDEEPTTEPKEESAVSLPAAPKSDELLRYEVSGSSTMRFALDPKSISIADGNTVRFTSVITSPSGVSNISYEGIRCKTAERKLYASGRPDGSWNAFPDAAWRRISSAGANSYQATLLKEFFCDGEAVAGKVPAMVERIRRSKPLR